MHYQRFKIHGSTELPPHSRPICKGPECARDAGDSGLCRSHYKQSHLGKPLTPLLVATKNLGRPSTCSFDGCDRPHKARGLCKAHRDHVAKGHSLREVAIYKPGALCSLDGCNEPNVANDLCRKHLQTQYDVRHKYGITLDAYRALCDEQENRCAICRGVNANGYRLSIDHDHSCCPGSKSCGKCVRGLLCAGCNYALGHMHDDVSRLLSAATYITKHSRKGVAAT